MKNFITQSIFIILFCIAITACGAPNPRKDLQNLPSLIEIVALDFNQQVIKLRVSHRNRSAREDNLLSCQLAIKDMSPIKLPTINLPDLTTFATETVQSNFTAGPMNLNLKQNQTLPYVLDCYLTSSTFSREHIISKATIYRIPGEENSYR